MQVDTPGLVMQGGACGRGWVRVDKGGLFMDRCARVCRCELGCDMNV